MNLDKSYLQKVCFLNYQQMLIAFWKEFKTKLLTIKNSVDNSI